MDYQMRSRGVDLSAAPRAVIGTAADLIYLVGRSVLGQRRMPTARDNAWAAVCADRRRAQQRADALNRLADNDKSTRA
jgi:hypothetical protein